MCEEKCSNCVYVDFASFMKMFSEAASFSDFVSISLSGNSPMRLTFKKVDTTNGTDAVVLEYYIGPLV